MEKTEYKRINLKEGLILVHEGNEEKKNINNKIAKIIPVWKWLL